MTYSTADKLLKDHIPDWYKMVCDFVDGEQFGVAGEYWIGPKLDPEIITSNDVLNNIKDSFIFSNKMSEVISRHLDALTTEDPELGYVPVEMDGETLTDEQETLIREATRLRDSFFELNNMDTLVEQAGRTLLWASRSSMRVYVPIGQLDAYNADGELVEYDADDVAYRLFPQTNIDDAISRLSIHHPDPDDAICLKQDDTSSWICIYRYRESTDASDMVSQPVDTRAEFGRGVGKNTNDRIEVSFTIRNKDDKEITVTKVLSSSDSAASDLSDIIDIINGESPDLDEGEEQPRDRVKVLNPSAASISGEDPGFTFSVGGILPMIEIFRERFVTDSMIKLQQSLDLSLSMIPRNITLAGFLERVITNGMPPGHYENGTYDSAGAFTPATNGRAVRFVPAAHSVGPATVNFYQGVKTTDPDGSVNLTKPGVHYKDPISPQHIIDSKNAAYTAILEEARQLHVLQNGDGGVSGVSRVQARAEFNNSLSSTVRQLNRLYEWLCIAPLKIAATLSGNEGMFDSIKPSVKIRVNLGPLTPEEIDAIIKKFEAGLMSRDTALQALGSRDVEAEVLRIEEDPSSRLDLVMKQVEIATGMVENGVDFAVVAELTGLDEDLVTKMFSAENNVVEQ
ncbi:MAG: hypothetical protein GY938_12900 [Ketobacter sp.]|nr:hypothetical protein [Ketobacter sp.]